MTKSNIFLVVVAKRGTPGNSNYGSPAQNDKVQKCLGCGGSGEVTRLPKQSKTMQESDTPSHLPTPNVSVKRLSAPILLQSAFCKITHKPHSVTRTDPWNSQTNKPKKAAQCSGKKAIT